MRKWERLLLKGERRIVEPEAAEKAFYEKAFDREERGDPNRRPLQGWGEIARFLQMSVRAATRAYNDTPEVRRYIHKDGGRYWANPSELMNLVPDLHDRKAGGVVRLQNAAKQPRKRGRFSA